MVRHVSLVLRSVDSAGRNAQRHDFDRYGNPHPRLQLAYRDIVGMFSRVRLVAICALPDDRLVRSLAYQLFRIYSRMYTNSVHLSSQLFLLATFEVVLVQICSQWLDCFVLLGDLIGEGHVIFGVPDIFMTTLLRLKLSKKVK